MAEALELLLTGDTRRWSDRSQIWREGWRNLHHASRTRIHAELLVEGVDDDTAIAIIDRYLVYYDYDRVHHGRLTRGRIPADIVYGARKMEAR